MRDGGTGRNEASMSVAAGLRLRHGAPKVVRSRLAHRGCRRRGGRSKRPVCIGTHSYGAALDHDGYITGTRAAAPTAIPAYASVLTRGTSARPGQRGPVHRVLVGKC